ncbi:MAG: hypothetical protein K6F09_02715 [Clostridiales bacterium]|nr:hypothetical protein [Clostridiales bacterium]
MKSRSKKLVSVFLSVLLVFGAFAFCFSVSAEASNVTIDLSSVPFGRIELNGNVVVTNQVGSVSVAPGTPISLTAVPSANTTFLYWVNVESNRIFSFDASYSFTAATDIRLQAVFALSILDENNTPVSHYISYLSMANNILSAYDCDVGYPDEYPENVPAIDGYTFTGEWSYTQDQIAASTENLFVYPVYVVKNQQFVVKTFLDSIDNQTSVTVYNRLDVAEVRAATTHNGEPFSYWAVIDNNDSTLSVASYYENYSFYVTNDIKLIPIYGAEPGNGIAIRISADVPNFTSGSVTVYSERSIFRTYTVIENGILLTLKTDVGANPSAFVIGGNSVAKATSQNNENNGTFDISVGNWRRTVTAAETGNAETIYPLVYARAYVILKDSSGHVLDPVYSDIHTVNYVDFGYTGEFEQDNVDDPFGD